MAVALGGRVLPADMAAVCARLFVVDDIRHAYQKLSPDRCEHDVASGVLPHGSGDTIVRIGKSEDIRTRAGIRCIF